MIEEGTNVYVNHCVYIEIRWEEGVLMIRFIFHLNKAFLLLQKRISQRIHFTTNRAVTFFQKQLSTTFLFFFFS